MSTFPKPYDYLNTPVEQVMALQKPIVPAPQFSALPPLAVGEQRYIAAKDGLYLEAKTHALHVCLKFANTPPMPFGDIKERVELAAGLLPASLFDAMCEHAVKHHPNEWAGVVELDAQQAVYTLTSLAVLEQSEAGVSYRREDVNYSRLVVDVHSHGNFAAGFSATDDACDIHGVYFAVVLGHCQSPASITAVCRIVVDGFHYTLDWLPWEEQHG